MVFRAIAVIALLGLWSVPALAQSATGEIQGTIVDQSGAFLPGVTVSIVNTATGATREVASDADGRFAAPGLPVGPYEGTASLQGFASQRQPNLRVQVGQTITLRLQLEVAAGGVNLTVVGPSPGVEKKPSQ